MTECKFVFFHKQATSGRMRFMVFENGSVLSGASLPDLSALDSDYDDQRDDEEDVISLPSSGFSDVLSAMGLEGNQAQIKIRDLGRVETPDETIAVHGVKLTDIDPPFDLAEKIDARFIEMTGARQLSEIDLEVLRRVYVFELGG